MSAVPYYSEGSPGPLTAVTVSGFKSLYEESRVEIRPLTILAGVNSSGKSSIMQPLLLLKQTLDARIDAGPLYLEGPNVTFTETSQFLSRPKPGRTFEPLVVEFELESGTTIREMFTHREGTGVELTQMIVRDALAHEFPIRPAMSNAEIVSILPPGVSLPQGEWRIERNRCWLACPIFIDGRRAGLDYFHPETTAVQSRILDSFHVSSARANSDRASLLTRPGVTMPGRFEEYIGGIAWAWREADDARLRGVGDALAYLGLSRSFDIQRVSETQVKLLVDRFPAASARKKPDFVNVADVGSGVAEVLPVLVALTAAEPRQLVYLEEPELNLHPRAQAALAQVLADAAMRGVRVVAETHSSLLLLAIQTLVAEGKLSPDLVKLHWFSRDKRGATYQKPMSP